MHGMHYELLLFRSVTYKPKESAPEDRAALRRVSFAIVGWLVSPCSFSMPTCTFLAHCMLSCRGLEIIYVGTATGNFCMHDNSDACSQPLAAKDLNIDTRLFMGWGQQWCATRTTPKGLATRFQRQPNTPGQC